MGLLCLALAPGLAIGLYLYYRDNLYDESWSKLARLFSWSFFATTLAIIPNEIGEHLVDPHESATHAFIYYFCVVALNEKLIKLMVVWVLAYRQFGQVYDGVLFTAISALGFASNENIFYVLTAGEDAALVRTLRAYSAVPCTSAPGWSGILPGTCQGSQEDPAGKRADTPGAGGSRYSPRHLQLRAHRGRTLPPAHSAADRWIGIRPEENQQSDDLLTQDPLWKVPNTDHPPGQLLLIVWG